MRGHTGSTPGEEGIRAARRDAAEHKRRHTLEYYEATVETIDPDDKDFQSYTREHGICFHEEEIESSGSPGGVDVTYRSLTEEALLEMFRKFWGDESRDLIKAHRVSIL